MKKSKNKPSHIISQKSKSEHNFYSDFTIPVNRILNIYETYDQIYEKIAFKKLDSAITKYEKNKRNKKTFNDLSKKIHVVEITKGSNLNLLIMEYENALAHIMKDLFTNNGNLIKGINQQINTSEIWKYEDIKELKNQIISDEINQFLRRNSFEQIKWIESKFGCSLNEGEDFWKKLFILSEKRNLFIHNDSRVTQEYIHKVKKIDPSEKIPELNKKIYISNTDLKSYTLIVIIAIFTINRRLCKKYYPNEFKYEVNKYINWIYYKFINTDNLIFFAPPLIDFALKFYKQISDSDRYIFLVNKALAQKNMNNMNDFDETLIELKKINIKIPLLQLAYLLLNEEYDSAEVIMKRLKSDKKLKEMMKERIFKEYIKLDRYNIFKKVLES